MGKLKGSKGLDDADKNGWQGPGVHDVGRGVPKAEN
jgi:hypothetical protein